jgi:hypothetical protein
MTRIHNLRGKFSALCAALCVVGIVLNAAHVNAQSALSDRCTALNTRYQNLASGWRWLSDDNLVFRVSNGEIPGGIFTLVLLWYRYQPSTGKLEQLDSSPYDVAPIPNDKVAQLKNLQPGEDGRYEGIATSKDGTKFIYARQNQDGQRPTFWLLDTTTNIEVDLGVSTVNGVQPDVFWFPDGKQFIVQNGSNVITPIRWVVQDGQNVLVQRLDELKPWSNFQPVFSDLEVAGVSPAATYIVAQPMTDEIWLYDLARQQLTKLPFSLRGHRSIVWRSETVFRGFSKMGIFEYDIPNARMTVVVTPDELDLKNIVGGAKLSPNGKFLTTPYFEQNGGPLKGLKICTLP